MSNNGESRLNAEDLPIEEKLDMLIEGLSDLSDKFDELIEKLSNLSLGGADFEIFDNEDN